MSGFSASSVRVLGEQPEGGLNPIKNSLGNKDAEVPLD